MINALAAHHGDKGTMTAAQLLRNTGGPDPWVTILVARVEGIPVGYAALIKILQLQFARRGMDMHHLFVRTSCRGMGMGQALIAQSVEVARAEGCSVLTVGTHPENHAAQEIYLKYGFIERSGAGPRFCLSL